MQHEGSVPHSQKHATCLSGFHGMLLIHQHSDCNLSFNTNGDLGFSMAVQQHTQCVNQWIVSLTHLATPGQPGYLTFLRLTVLLSEHLKASRVREQA